MVQWWFFTASLRATQTTDSYKICKFSKDHKMHMSVNSADRKSIESRVLLCRRG